MYPEINLYQLNEMLNLWNLYAVEDEDEWEIGMGQVWKVKVDKGCKKDIWEDIAGYCTLVADFLSEEYPYDDI
jgi:hypothetical protein